MPNEAPPQPKEVAVVVRRKKSSTPPPKAPEVAVQMQRPTPGELLTVLRKRAKLTQQDVADRSGLTRVEVARVEGGWNAASSGRMRTGFAKAFKLWPETVDALLEGKLTVDQADARRGEVTGARSPRLADRPEWAEVLPLAQALAAQFYGHIGPSVWTAIEDVLDSPPFPRPLTPAFVAQIGAALALQPPAP